MPDVTAYAAHLRVYEPLAAFEGEERRRWEQYVRAGNIPSVAGGLEMEHLAGVRALVGRPPALLPVLGDHAFVTEVDGVTLVCPWRTRVRAYEASGDFRDLLPDELADAFIPRGVAEAAEDIADALAALGDGDASRAAAAYGRVTARMKALQGVESAN